MYYKKNVDYVELLWEDFTYQINNRGHKNQEKMYYPRFTKVIIHKLLASGSSEGVDFESKVTDESKAKYSNTNSEDDNESDDTNDEGSQNDDEGYNDAQDSERTDSDEEENPNPNLNVDEEEETQEEEYIHTPDYYVPTDEEIDDENMEFYDEEYDDLYKDVNVRSKVAEHEEVGKGYVEMTDATRESGSQENSYEQVI
ncbi:hypothetical protein Tco_0186592, partial [Tanacetum coccineum]